MTDKITQLNQEELSQVHGGSNILSDEAVRQIKQDNFGSSFFDLNVETGYTPTKPKPKTTD